MLAAALLLCVLTFAGVISPWALLMLTFFLNIGSAMNNPAWQAIVPSLVPRSELPDAISINSAGFNLARAVGPALGGLAVAAFASVTTGAGTVFLFNAASFVAVYSHAVHLAPHTALQERTTVRAVIWFHAVRTALRAFTPPCARWVDPLRGGLFTIFVSAVGRCWAGEAEQDLYEGAMGTESEWLYGLGAGRRGGFLAEDLVSAFRRQHYCGLLRYLRVWALF